MNVIIFCAFVIKTVWKLIKVSPKLYTSINDVLPFRLTHI